jgi:hydrogenase maturation protein HypF
MEKPAGKSTPGKAYRLMVKGTVQGVGFRPFIYRLARRFGYDGYVKNVGQGVEIFVENGRQDDFKYFLKALKEEAPPLARIEGIDWLEVEPGGWSEFIIDRSVEEESFVFIAPDIATCVDCLKEIESREERRYQYPFTNCTNCGPRYTIVKKLPYDRAKTTMARFKMCPDCQKEYEDPDDRRYHAQPIACPRCGPAITILEARSRKHISSHLDYAAALIKKGKILAIKGLGGFHLVCDALNKKAVERLRKIKKRKTKPLALMADSLKTIKKFAQIRPDEKSYLTSPGRPIVLLRKKKDIPLIAPGADTLGFMLPYTPLHHLLLKKIPLVVATSSNRKEAPVIKDENEITPDLCDFILTHNREIAMRADDSVLRVVNGKPLFLRRARGYVPFPQAVPPEVKAGIQILAVGGELKNTISIYKNGYIITSQFLGDLDDYQNFSYFQETIAHLEKLFSFKAQAVISDLHPDFRSTRFARSLKIPHYQVQHHYAHVLAPLLEHNISPEEKVLGVSFDGFGYGEDGQAWGGEFLMADYSSYQRYAHLDYVPLPGGDRASREPWRMAVVYLRCAFGQEFPQTKPISRIAEPRLRTILKMIDNRINSPLTSSVGRLFDAVSFICGLAPETIEFEAQAPSLLEAAASFCPVRTNRAYDFAIDRKSLPYRVDFSQTIREIIRDLTKKVEIEKIALTFHNTLARTIVSMAQVAREEKKINTVVLAGGVFLNRILNQKAGTLLRQKGFKVLRPVYYSPNDESLSLGQMAYALNKLKTPD